MKIFLIALKLINWFISKKQKNNLTEKPSAPIVEEPTSGKIIMEKTTEDIVAHVREWAIDKVGDLHEEVYKNQKGIGNLDDACAIYQEFVEWIEPETKEIDILSLEKET